MFIFGFFALLIILFSPPILAIDIPAIINNKIIVTTKANKVISLFNLLFSNIYFLINKSIKYKFTLYIERDPLNRNLLQAVYVILIYHILTSYSIKIINDTYL